MSRTPRQGSGAAIGPPCWWLLATASLAQAPVAAQSSALPQSVEVVAPREPLSTGPAAAVDEAAAGSLLRLAPPRPPLVLQPETALPWPALRLEDLAAAIPGMLVEPLNAGLSTSVRLRGFAVARIHRDGLPDIQRMFVRDLATVERVEVLRGSAGALAGIASPGGVVNLVSRQPGPDMQDSVQLVAGGRGYARAVLDTEGDLPAALAAALPGGGTLQWRTVASAQEGYSDVAGLPQRHHQVSTAVDWRWRDGRLGVDLGEHRNHTPFGFGTVITNGGAPGRMPAPAVVAWDRLFVREGGGPTTRRYHEARLAFEQQLTPGWRALARYSRGSVTRDETLIGFWTLRNADTLSSYWTRYHDSYAQQAWRAELQGRLQFGGLAQRMSLGADRFDVRLRFDGTQNIGATTITIDRPVIDLSLDAPGPVTRRYTDERSTEQGVWASWQADLPAHWRLDLLARRQHYAIASTRQPGARLPVGEASATPWLLGLSWQPDAPWQGWWTWSSGMEPNRGTDRLGGFLPPQRSRQHEIGAARRDGPFTASLAAWSIDLDHLAMADPAERGTLMAAGARRAQGLELGAHWRAGTLDLRGHASWMRSRQTIKTNPALGDSFVGVPRLLGGLQAGWLLPGAWPQGQPRLSAAWSLVGSRFGDAANTVRVAGYGKLDMALHWPVVGGEAKLLVGNLTDQRHVVAVTAVDDIYQGRRRNLALGWQGRW